MASETIDKTMLEAMCNGVFPVTTSGNSFAIGLPSAPENETPKAIADFILAGKATHFSQDELKTIVETKHGLNNLVSKMGEYIRKGN